MRTLDDILLRVVVTILTIATLVLCAVLIPQAALTVESLVHSAYSIIPSFQSPVWSSVLYQVAIAAWFMFSS